jgi:fucose 4-O-acetylase-like acetyltransferase
MFAIAQERAAPATLRPPSRRLWPDSAKGLGSFCVVLVHTIDGLKAPGILPAHSAWDFWSVLNYTYQVPVFFFISGLFTDRSYEKFGFRSFLKTKLEFIAYPYVLWQTLQILLMLASGSTTHKPTPEMLLWFPFQPYMQFWFIYTLLLVFSLYAVLKLAGLPSFAIFAISVGMLFLPRMGWTPYNDLCRSMIYFGFGLVLRERMALLDDVRSRLLLLAAATCACATMALVRSGVDVDSPFRPVAAILGIAGSVFFSVVVARQAWWKGVCVLGRYTLQIYVAHVVFAAATRITLLKVFHVESLLLHICLGVLAGVGGPLLLVALQRMPAGLYIPLFQAKIRDGLNISLPAHE